MLIDQINTSEYRYLLIWYILRIEGYPFRVSYTDVLYAYVENDDVNKKWIV